MQSESEIAEWIVFFLFNILWGTNEKIDSRYDNFVCLLSAEFERQ